MTIGDTDIPKRDVMMLLLTSARHDPAAVDRPDEFDPDRETVRHLGFGKGPHFCLGAPLARLDAAVALSKVTARFPQARLAGRAAVQAQPDTALNGVAGGCVLDAFAPEPTGRESSSGPPKRRSRRIWPRDSPR
jgi:cytochrome P450